MNKVEAIKVLVDEAGRIKASIANHERRLEEIKRELDKTGCTDFDGEWFHITLSHCEGRLVYDMDAIREKLSPQFLTAHSRRGEPFVRMNVSARIISIGQLEPKRRVA